jgi:hypothetical protein
MNTGNPFALLNTSEQSMIIKKIPHAIYMGYLNALKGLNASYLLLSDKKYG